MDFNKKIASLVALSLSFIQLAYGANSQWTSGSGNWSTGPWNPSAPTAADSATIGNQVAGPYTVTMDVSSVITSLSLANGPYILSRAGTNTLTLSGPTLSVSSGTQTIHDSPITGSSNAFVDSTASLTISTASSSSLNIEAYLFSSADVNFTGGTINVQNVVPITGSLIAASVATSGTMTVSNSNVTFSNSQPTANTSGFGTVIASSSNLFVNSGSLNLYNNGTHTNTITTISNVVDGGGTRIAVNGGTLSLLNDSGGTITGNSSSTSAAHGTYLVALLSGIEINNGTLSVTNRGTIQENAAGCYVLCFANLTINGGLFALQNTGTIQSITRLTSGNQIMILGQLIMNGGMITNVNSGNLIGPNVFGSVISSPSIVQNAGVLINDANILTDSLMVNPSASYKGKGVISPRSSSLSVTNSGTVFPVDVNGNPSIMTINGTYTQNPNGVLQVLIQNASSYSQLAVNGTANLAGTLQIDPRSTISAGNTFVIVKANQIEGFFTEILSPFPSLQPNIVYQSNAVDLSFLESFLELKVLFTPVSEKYVKLAQPLFSSLNETNMRLTRKMEKLRGRFAKEVIEKNFSENALYGQEDVSLQSITYQIDEPLATFTDTFDDAMPESETKEKEQRLTASLGTRGERPWNVYVAPKGQIGNVYSGKEAQGYKEWSAGFFTGFDYAFSHVGVGFLVEYERIKANVGKSWGNFHIDHVHGDAYATYAASELPEFAINGILGAGYDWYDIDRNFFEANSGAIKGSPKGAELDALLGAEYSFRNSVFSIVPKNLQIIPMISLQYAYLHIDDFTEKGNSLHAMKIEKQNVKTLRTDLGVRVNYLWDFKDVTISPALNINWQREFLDKSYTLDFLPINFKEHGFSVVIPKSGRNIALAGADFLVTLYDRHSLEAGYDFEYNALYHTHFLYLGYNVRF